MNPVRHLQVHIMYAAKLNPAMSEQGIGYCVEHIKR